MIKQEPLFILDELEQKHICGECNKAFLLNEMYIYNKFICKKCHKIMQGYTAPYYYYKRVE